MGPAELTTQWEKSDHEIKFSTPFSGPVRNEWRYTSTPLDGVDKENFVNFQTVKLNETIQITT
jgi:hypothetical protein